MKDQMQKPRTDTRFVATAPALGFLAFSIGVSSLLAAPAALPGTGSPGVAASKANHSMERRIRQIPVPPPPMGWSSWNSFSNTVDSAIIMEQTKALVATGMKKAGYRYINLDEGWWLGERDEDGNILVDPKQWPALAPGERAGDMSNVVRYIHSFGLKAGIYTDAGKNGCSFYSPDIGPHMPHTGSEGHYDQDFLQFAKWGFDYVKVDWCGGNGENLDPAVQYTAIAHAIARAERITGHSLFFSICNWGKLSPWTWAPGIGGVPSDIWRTSGDIVNPIVANSIRSQGLVNFPKVLSNFDQGVHPEAEHTGFYNDPDMMVVGMPGITERQDRVHLALWAISGAPMMEGADLTKLSKATIGILTNPEMIAVDQDSRGLQGILVAQPGPGLQVWSKPLADTGEHAVVLLNRTDAAASIPVTWSEIGLEPSSSATVRDVWARKSLGSYRSSYTVTVPAEDAAMLTIRGVDDNGTRYTAESASAQQTEEAAAALCGNCSAEAGVAMGHRRTLTFKVAARRGAAYLQISYTNTGKSFRVAQLKVNEQIPTNINFPPTGERDGTVTIEVNLGHATKTNSLIFSSSSCAPGPAIDSITVLAGGR
jgi:Alpha galactosidase A/Alpha galactosidase C-terminal beta sandwich domain/Alpha-galactosidase, CBM13 domain